MENAKSIGFWAYIPDEYGGNTLTGLLMQIRLNPDYQPDEQAESEFDHDDQDEQDDPDRAADNA